MSRAIRLIVVTALVGVGAGLGGLLVTLALTGLERLAAGTTATAPGIRVLALGVAGVVGALGWWALRRWGAPVVSIEKSLTGQRMPAGTTVANVSLQTIIVGLGASIGRELAPRELGALVAGWLTRTAGVSARESRILIACGAGAGLAAVYNVPLGGAIFIVEVLLAEVSFAVALPAFATCAIATVVARLVVPVTPLYSLPQFTISPSLLVWSVIAGPVIGLAALGFVRLVGFAEAHRPRSWGVLIVMPVVFVGVGVLSIPFPTIIGNGLLLGQLAFTGAVPLSLLAALVVAKVAATSATIGSGAAGGTLTPSLAVGAALGGVLGGLWVLLWPGTPIAAFAFVAASAFLASSLRAPFTALVLVVEFTNQGPSLLIPTMLAIGGSVGISYLAGRRRLAGID